MGRAGLNRKTALATTTLTLAAEAPDLDVIGNFKDPVFGFAHHRGFTHSFLGLFFVSALVVGFVYLVWRVRGKKLNNPDLPPRWGLLFAYAYLAGVVHILLDFTNNYGVRPFWPFNEKWYSWDIVFIVEPAILILLFAGLLFPLFVHLVHRLHRTSEDRENASALRAQTQRFAATFALVGVVALWGARDYEHRRAVSALEARHYGASTPIRASAYPYWWNVFRWYGVVETRDSFISTMIDSEVPQLGADGQMQTHQKLAETPVTTAAKDSYLGHVYLDWAKYPVVQAERIVSTESGGSDPKYIVHFIDLRYEYPDFKRRGALSASVELDDKLRVVSQRIGLAPDQVTVRRTGTNEYKTLYLDADYKGARERVGALLHSSF